MAGWVKSKSLLTAPDHVVSPGRLFSLTIALLARARGQAAVSDSAATSNAAAATRMPALPDAEHLDQRRGAIGVLLRDVQEPSRRVVRGAADSRRPERKRQP